MRLAVLLCGFLGVLLTAPALAVTIDLPAGYDQSIFDMLVLNDSLPERILGYNVQTLRGDLITLRLRYLNFDALNIDFGDSVTAG